MADSNTTTYGFLKPEVGASADTWGTKLNGDMDDVDALLTVLTTAGGTTTYTLTSGLSLAAYVSGQSFLIKMNATNTGASTLNVDSLGAKDITKNGTTALVSGDLVSGVIYRVAYDGTRFQVVGVVAPFATQAQMEAAASADTIVTPARVHNHPGVAKVWGSLGYSGGTPQTIIGYGISSLTDTGTGQITVNFSTAFSAATYAVVTQKYTNYDYSAVVGSKATGSVLLTLTNDVPTNTDLPVDFCIFGDQ